MSTADVWAQILLQATITVFIACTIWLCITRPERIFEDGRKAYGLAKVMSAVTYLAVHFAALRVAWIQTEWISTMWLEIWPYSDGETAETLRSGLVFVAWIAIYVLLDGYIEGLRVRAREALGLAAKME